ncbi:putative Na(+)/H(+) antiporter [Neolecta irregularis DAH-3]|uniref:Putative Na(+)/H(+) antiporter n=1 Tax=Neolecta irregularis (strain DAH-3) TaxID=1198029 RepID=A0A1U7LKB8_NEOID|nr:putative Na(+)/H(+) antiporter [Neolecta irregularis DAH-3]|eukprot:OLL23106.1 putative Na(+)/H(+) antiporter [Neolecta irregularis DAH-3]
MQSWGAPFPSFRSSLFLSKKNSVATLVGIIFGPHALNLFDPLSWGNADQITLEFSRIALIVQVFAVGVELPNAYMARHAWSLFILLVPVMATGWIVSSVIFFLLLPKLSFVESLVAGACITATDPILASSIVGKGKFAKRVPGHLRNLLSAESGCNDGMAFPFLYLALYIIQNNQAGAALKDWVLITVLYEVVFGCFLGAVIGIAGRKLVKFAERNSLIDRESFLVIYLTISLFCAGIGTIIGTDDLLVSFAAGTAFAWDGWFTQKTEESHVSNVIDLLLNLSFFIFFGAAIPWEQFNAPEFGLVPWRLIVIAILIMIFRRIPAILLAKPFTPDIKSWREALFCGHFGPIGVGAIFVSILARAELETDTTTPLAHLPADPTIHNYYAIRIIWPLITFIVLTSILIHGSSIAVFTLGKHLNSLSFTISYTRENTLDNPTWLDRLPRIELGQSTSKAKPDEERNCRRSRSNSRRSIQFFDEQKEEQGEQLSESTLGILDPGDEVYQEGDMIIIENSEGEVVKKLKSDASTDNFIKNIFPNVKWEEAKAIAEDPNHPMHGKLAGFLKSITKDIAGEQSLDVTTMENEPSCSSTSRMIRVGSDERITAAATKESEEAAKKERAEETEAERRRREAVLHGSEESEDEVSFQESPLEVQEDNSHDSAEPLTLDESSPRITFDRDVRTGQVEPGYSIYQRRDNRGRGRGG